MYKKISYFIRCMVTIFRFCIYKMIYGKRFSCTLVQFISIGTDFIINNGGRMTILGRNMIEKLTLLHADGGQITLNRNFINRNCMIVAHQCIHIGYGTTIGPNVCIYDHDHDISTGGSVVLLCISALMFGFVLMSSF